MLYYLLIFYILASISFSIVLRRICTYSRAQNTDCVENPQSSNCVALGGSSPKSVEVLEISQAFMTTLPTAYFLQFGYKNVSEIKIRRSHVMEIDDDAFAGLDQLKRLDLSHNSIKSLRCDSFRDLQQLEMLVLSFNKINEIEQGTLRNLVRLIYLNIRNNYLSDIPREIEETSDLRYLDLSHNDFSNTDVIIKSSSLNFLRLSSCKIATLVEDSFTETPELRLLDISNNLLTTLPHQLLRPLYALVTLDVTDNHFDDGLPDIIKPENLINIISSTDPQNATLLDVIRENSSTQPTSDELTNKIKQYFIPSLFIFFNLFSFFLFMVTRINPLRRKTLPMDNTLPL